MCATLMLCIQAVKRRCGNGGRIYTFKTAYIDGNFRKRDAFGIRLDAAGFAEEVADLFFSELVLRLGICT